MKIGPFAAKNNISIDTVRYYMELKLLIPGRHGGQYEFDKSCQIDIEEIMWLKSADFSLNEIQRIFSLKRLTSLKSDEDMQYYLSLFGSKKLQLMDKRTEIDSIIAKLDEKMEALQSMKTFEGIELGIPMELLRLFSCPVCGAGLKLKTGNIRDGMVMDGMLDCCNQQLEIKDGIMTSTCDMGRMSRMSQEDKSDGHFIEQTSSDYVNLLYKSGQWIKGRLGLERKEEFVILEPGTGSGLFLHGVLGELPGNCTYICVDHDFELLRNTKDTLERRIRAERIPAKILFICCDFRQIPILDDTVDVLLDHFGTTNFNFYNEGHLIRILDRLVKPGGKWIGDYLCFKPGAKSLTQFDTQYHKYFYMDNIKKTLAESGYLQQELENMGTTQKGGIHETFFIDGDTLYDFTYLGKKPE